jgi:sterol desaturase/sphingolipid hydroxylase (fatty acid hydroxylase superfamily)
VSLLPNLEQLQQGRGVLSLGWLVVLLAWESAAPFLPLFRSPGDRGRHGLRNLAIGWINGLAIALPFAFLWKWVADVAAGHGFGLLNLLPLPAWGHLVGALLLFDLWTYLWHRAGHQLAPLWKFHRMHHSDPQMDVTTSNRFHVVEILLSSVLRIALIPLLGIHFAEVVIYETLLQAVVQLQHANVRLPAPLERALRGVFVTPVMHKIHHSRWQPETDSNFSSLLSLWDRLFRTFRLRSDPENIQLGLDGFDGTDRQTLRGLWRTPFEDPTHPPSPRSPRRRPRP